MNRFEGPLFAIILAVTLVLFIYTAEPNEPKPLPVHQPSCAEALMAPTDGNCAHYERELLGRGYVKLPNHTYYLPPERRDH